MGQGWALDVQELWEAVREAGSDMSHDPTSAERAIDEALGGAVVLKEHSPEYIRWKLMAPPGSELKFEVFLYLDDGEPQLIAGTNDSRDALLWAAFFEQADYRSTAERDQAFFKTLRNVLTHRTRIRWRQGRWSWSAECEYEAGDEWRKISGYSATGTAKPRGVTNLPLKGTLEALPVLRPSPNT